VARGYANAGTFPPDVRYNDELRAAEREAREAERGLWGAC
jgi:micrococcal nuclease